MKIINGKYPQVKDWSLWVKFTKGAAINRVFLYRLAAYAKYVVKTPITISCGFRSIADQALAYKRYLAGDGNLAAKPGQSWHGVSLAVDIPKLSTGKYPGTIGADYALFMAGKPETGLAKYGLCHTVSGEPWHIQPIETKGFPLTQNQWFADADDKVNTVSGYPLLQVTDPLTEGNHVKLLQKWLYIDQTGRFDAINTDAALVAFQKRHNLTADGICGRSTWSAVIRWFNQWPVPTRTLRLGNIGKDVKWIRRQLNCINLTNKVNFGVFDAILRADVKAFQARHGLKVDGIVGAKTRKKLQSFS